jgi:hypothetical protein
MATSPRDILHQIITHAKHWERAVMGSVVGIGTLIIEHFTQRQLSWTWFLVLVLAGLAWHYRSEWERVKKQEDSNDILSSDPWIYFQLIDHRNELARRTLVELHNRGGGMAHKIVIRPIELERRRAVFKEVDFLDMNAKCEVIPEISGMSPIFRYDLLNFIRGEVNDSGKGTGRECTVSAFATYKDQTEKRCFKAYFDIIYYLLNDALHREKSLISDVKPLFEIRHKKTVRISC